MQNIIIGWDIGGAHLKAARAENGVVAGAVQIACPLWLGLAELDRAFDEATAAIGRAPLNAITMTGELSDAFATREEGVAGLPQLWRAGLTPARCFLRRPRRFCRGRDVAQHATAIASANWHASAALTGMHVREALFIDMGSTTIDIIPVRERQAGKPRLHDAERLAHGELVYTGLARTFLMAGPKLVPFAGRWTPLMNEWFAHHGRCSSHSRAIAGRRRYDGDGGWARKNHGLVMRAAGADDRARQQRGG